MLSGERTKRMQNSGGIHHRQHGSDDLL